MSITTVLLIAIALGMDAFSMAVGIGVTGIRRGQILLVSGTVCLFHIFMPLAGLTAGGLVGQAVGRWARLFGAGILVLIGSTGLFRVIRERRSGLPSGEEPVPQIPRVVFGPLALVVLGGSVSLDALSVGFGLGTFSVNLPLTVLVFGAVAGLMTAGGFIFGRSLGSWLGDKADIAGAVILLLIGLKMMFS